MSSIDYFTVPTATHWQRLVDLLIPAYLSACTVVRQADPVQITGKLVDGVTFFAFRARAFKCYFATGDTQAAANQKIAAGTPDTTRNMEFASNAPPWVLLPVIADILYQQGLVDLI